MNDGTDPFGLGRFVRAQLPLYATALAELTAGRKQSHWMWFVFPQADGLGRSAMARTYAIHSHDEAFAYLSHHLLGTRLVECARTALGHKDKSVHDIFGSPDDLKFHSSMTLFAAISGDGPFQAALDHYFRGIADQKTLGILKRWAS